MAGGVMITNGGAHSAEDWAMATATRIFAPSPEMTRGRMVLFTQVQMGIAQALMLHHEWCQKHERKKLAVDAASRLGRDYIEDRDARLAEADLAIADIQKAVAGTAWEEHWKKEDVLAAVRNIIASDLMTARDIDRQWSQKDPAVIGLSTAKE